MPCGKAVIYYYYAGLATLTSGPQNTLGLTCLSLSSGMPISTLARVRKTTSLRGVAPTWAGMWLKIATGSHRGHFSHCAAQSAEATEWLRVALRTLLLSGSAVRLERPRGRASRSGPIVNGHYLIH